MLAWFHRCLQATQREEAASSSGTRHVVTRSEASLARLVALCHPIESDDRRYLTSTCMNHDLSHQRSTNPWRRRGAEATFPKPPPPNWRLKKARGEKKDGGDACDVKGKGEENSQTLVLSKGQKPFLSHIDNLAGLYHVYLHHHHYSHTSLIDRRVVVSITTSELDVKVSPKP